MAQGKGAGNAPVKLQTSLSSFTDYLASGSSARINCVTQQVEMYSQKYSPGPAFYHAWIGGLVDGRKDGSDELTLRRVANKQHDDNRRRHYEELTNHWLKALGTRPGEWVKVGRAMWVTPSLDVKITPELGLKKSNGEIIIVKLYVKSEPLSKDAANAALWLMQKHRTALHADGRVAVLDVRREKWFNCPARFKQNFDGWLRAEATGYAQLWQSIASVA